MKTIFHILLVITITLLTKAQPDEIGCVSSYPEDGDDFSQRGGKYITSAGELKVLVVFARFKDDNNPHQHWSVNSYPAEMSEFVDPDMQTSSAHFLNLSNYYNQMSFGNFKVTGRSIGVETPYPIEHYIPQNEIYPNRSHANKDILLSVDDSINFSDYDNWTYISNYFHSNEPDGVVDMIIVIWRGLVFSDNWNGESSLGGGSEFAVENNQVKIRMGYGGFPGYGSYGSGVTIQYWGERSRERNFKAVIHEVAHWLIHIDHPYSSFNHTFWGMLTLTSEGICANAYERERVAWINPAEITGTILAAPMGDYITTPSAYKYHPENGYEGEMYFFENHQQLSIYDNGISNTNDKGIFILHFQHGYYFGDCVRILTSDGFWNWDSLKTENCWGNNVPSFKKSGVNRFGKGNRDRITTPDSCCEFLFSYIDEYGQSACNDWLHGYGFNNSFNTSFNDVFSSWSNPPAKTWDGQSTDFIMEVINESGSIVTARFAVQNSVGGKPSKPFLGWNPSEPDSSYKYNKIFLAWGADHWDGYLIEPDINWSELQRKIDAGSWETVYSGLNRVWSDSSSFYNPNGTESIYFRVRVRDSQDKWSMWSEIFDTKMINKIVTYTESLADNNVSLNDYVLYQNYPNPFNPSTTLSFVIGSASGGSFVSLKVYDILGNEVATLVNEEKPAGRYEIEFNVAQVSRPEIASGVYFYRLQAGNYIETKKMVLIR